MRDEKDNTWNNVTETKLSFTKDRNDMTISELRERMKRAKKRALKRAKRYYVRDPPFNRGVIDEKSLSPYRMLSLYADRILPHWDGDPDDKPSIVQTIDLKKLVKDTYIYCSSAARIVTRVFSM